MFYLYSNLGLALSRSCRTTGLLQMPVSVCTISVFDPQGYPALASPEALNELNKSRLSGPWTFHSGSLVLSTARNREAVADACDNVSLRPANGLGTPMPRIHDHFSALLDLHKLFPA
jgi:hypothetical protein